MNSIILIGRPTGTPTVTYTPSQMAIAKFSLAVDRDRKSKAGEKEADCFDVTAFGKTAESCERYAKARTDRRARPSWSSPTRSSLSNGLTAIRSRSRKSRSRSTKNHSASRHSMQISHFR